MLSVEHRIWPRSVIPFDIVVKYILLVLLQPGLGEEVGGVSHRWVPLISVLNL